MASRPVKSVSNKRGTHYQAEVTYLKLLLNFCENVRIQGFTEPHNMGTEEPIAAVLLTPVYRSQSDSVTLLTRMFQPAKWQSSLHYLPLLFLPSLSQPSPCPPLPRAGQKAADAVLHACWKHTFLVTRNMLLNSCSAQTLNLYLSFTQLLKHRKLRKLVCTTDLCLHQL